jgi:hypothetical protein
MTTTTIVAEPRRSVGGGLAGALRSEWTKIRSVRSTYWTLAASVVASIGFGAISAASLVHNYRHFSAAALQQEIARGNFDPVAQTMTGIILGQIALAVFGVLVISSEYRNRMIRTTLTAVPVRPRMMAAKLATFGLLSLVVGEVIAFASFFVGIQIENSSLPLSVSLGDPGVLRAVVGIGVYLALTGVIGLGLGLIIRHSAGAITAVIGFLLVLPTLATALPQPWQHRVGEALPLSIGEQTASTTNLSDHLSPGVGLLVLAIYGVVALAIGGWLLVSRDA